MKEELFESQPVPRNPLWAAMFSFSLFNSFPRPLICSGLQLDRCKEKSLMVELEQRPEPSQSHFFHGAKGNKENEEWCTVNDFGFQTLVKERKEKWSGHKSISFSFIYWLSLEDRSTYNSLFTNSHWYKLMYESWQGIVLHCPSLDSSGLVFPFLLFFARPV
jgi:hypothetical protein